MKRLGCAKSHFREYITVFDLTDLTDGIQDKTPLYLTHFVTLLAFSRYSAAVHCLVHGHVTSNNETVSRQMPWAGNIAKAMTSNEKQFTVTREMLTAVACDGWNLSAVFKFCLCFVLLYNKSLNDWSLGNSEFCFPRISMFPSTSSRETLRFLGNKIHFSPRDQSLSV